MGDCSKSLGTVLFIRTNAFLYQRRQLQQLAGKEREGVNQPGVNLHQFPDILQIPRLKLSSVVDEGVDDRTLSKAVGHVPGTKFPGKMGNSVLAAHRDTYFRRPGEVTRGDEVIYKTSTSGYRYKVADIRIVEASDITALADTPGSQLTLITCYPFFYIGPAPKRFLVVARSENSPQIGTISLKIADPCRE